MGGAGLIARRFYNRPFFCFYTFFLCLNLGFRFSIFPKGRAVILPVCEATPTETAAP